MLLVGAFGHVRVGKRGDCECGMAWDGLFRLFLKKLLICFGEATWVNQSPKWRKCPECSRVLVDVRGAGLLKLTGMQQWPQMTTRYNRVQPGNKCTHASLPSGNKSQPKDWRKAVLRYVSVHTSSNWFLMTEFTVLEASTVWRHRIHMDQNLRSVSSTFVPRRAEAALKEGWIQY